MAPMTTPELPAALRRVWTWAPLLLWCSLIFGFSQDANSGSTSRALLVWLFGPAVLAPEILEPAQFLIRKAAHTFEFLVLALLAWRSLGGRSWAAAVLFTVLAAALDEVHQLYVPGRGGDWRDVCVDTGGALLSRAICYSATLQRMLLWGTGARPGSRN
jgi:VanZ family protein